MHTSVIFHLFTRPQKQPTILLIMLIIMDIILTKENNEHDQTKNHNLCSFDN